DWSALPAGARRLGGRTTGGGHGSSSILARLGPGAEARELAWDQTPRERFQRGGNLRDLPWVVGPERRGEGLLDGRRDLLGRPAQDFGRRRDGRPAAVPRIDRRQQRPALPEPGDRRGDVALRETGSGGDLPNRASRMLEDVDQDRPDARRELMEAGAVDRLL